MVVHELRKCIAGKSKPDILGFVTEEIKEYRGKSGYALDDIPFSSYIAMGANTDKVNCRAKMGRIYNEYCAYRDQYKPLEDFEVNSPKDVHHDSKDAVRCSVCTKCLRELCTCGGTPTLDNLETLVWQNHSVPLPLELVPGGFHRVLWGHVLQTKFERLFQLCSSKQA